MAVTSAQFSLTIRVELPQERGSLSKVTSAITQMDGAIVAVDTVEERILALQERKRELAEAALGGGAGGAALTKQDLLDLLA